MVLLTKDMVPGLVAAGASCRSDEEAAPRFTLGDNIVVRNLNPTGHTRLPRYVRGKRGVVERDHGVFHFPDTMAHGGFSNAQHCYSVRFTAEELWGPSPTTRGALYIDLFEDYMDSA